MPLTERRVNLGEVRLSIAEAGAGPRRLLLVHGCHASLAVIPDAGHCPQFENPDAWWKALTAYLADIDL